MILRFVADQPHSQRDRRPIGPQSCANSSTCAEIGHQLVHAEVRVVAQRAPSDPQRARARPLSGGAPAALPAVALAHCAIFVRGFGACPRAPQAGELCIAFRDRISIVQALAASVKRGRFHTHALRPLSVAPRVGSLSGMLSLARLM